MNPDILLDPEIAERLDQMPPQRAWDPEWMRAEGEKLLGAQDPVLPDGVEREVHYIGADGAPDVEARVISVPDPQQMILSIHGGGFVSGQARYDDAWNATLARETNAVVISPNYRRPPEDRYPAALLDCLAVWVWAKNVWPELPSVIYGDSAGGNLAAASTLYLRDHGEALPERLFLIEPVLDARLSTVSMKTADHTPVWDLPNARASWSAYLGGQEPDVYASPSLAQDLSGFPPTFVLANQCDPMRDENTEFARKLTESNVLACYILLPGTAHAVLGFDGPRVSEKARRVVFDALRGDTVI